MEPYEVYPLFFSRNIGAITLEQQDTLYNSSAIVLGCGGIGGIALEMLARTGVGKLTIVDGDMFDISNINRQIFSTYERIGSKKVEAAEKFIKEINPSINITAIDKNLDKSNAEKLLKGNDVIVDGLDNAVSRVIATRAAKDIQIPFVFGACEKSNGYSTVFMPKTESYEHAFNLPSNGKEIDDAISEVLQTAQHCDSVLGIVSNSIGCIESMLAVSVLLKKELVQPPNFVHISAFNKVPFSVGPL